MTAPLFLHQVDQARRACVADATPPTVDLTATPDAPDIRLTWSAVDSAPSSGLAACRGVASVLDLQIKGWLSTS